MDFCWWTNWRRRAQIQILSLSNLFTLPAACFGPCHRVFVLSFVNFVSNGIETVIFRVVNDGIAVCQWSGKGQEERKVKKGNEKRILLYRLIVYGRHHHTHTHKLENIEHEWISPARVTRIIIIQMNVCFGAHAIAYNISSIYCFILLRIN